MLLKFIFFVLSTAYADPANHFVCRSADEKTKVTYSTTSFAGVPMLTYVFEKTSLNFSGPKLKRANNHGFMDRNRRVGRKKNITVYTNREHRERSSRVLNYARRNDC